MNNDLRTIINTLDSIEEGEMGRKIGSKIGGFFGDKAAKIGGDLGDKTGDFIDKFNPFSKSTDKEVDKDTASDSGNSSGDLKSASGVSIGQPFTPAPTSTKFTGSKVDDNGIKAGGTKYPGMDVKGDTITGHGFKYDIENQYAANPAKFRIAQNWKDGQPLDADGISYTNSWSGEPIPQDILHIEARKGWDKPMVNFDGSPILAGRENDNTKPKEPDHPYYHMIRVETGERQDPNRVSIMSMLKKDKYGNQRHHYEKSAANTIAWPAPSGFSPGGLAIINKHSEMGEVIAGYQKDSSVIWIERSSMAGSLAHSVSGQMVGISRSVKGEELERYEKSKGNKVSVKNVENGITTNSAVGAWWGQAFRVGGSRFGSDSVTADVVNQIATSKDDKRYNDSYKVNYFGPYSDWKSGGKSAFLQVAANTKYADGFGPVKSRSVTEELSRIIDLAWR
jgi:hypothetical protein